jgi:hypothetical protein
MYFILDICQEIFPELPCKRDGEPELCIARGLSRWGRVYLRTEGFMEEISQFLDKELSGIIGNNIPIFLDKLAEELADGLTEEVIVNSVKSWRNRKILTLKQLESEIEQQASYWLTGKEANTKITNCLVDWLSTIQQQTLFVENMVYL